jgi:hypothetical protein
MESRNADRYGLITVLGGATVASLIVLAIQDVVPLFFHAGDHLPGVARVDPVAAGGLIFTPGFEGSSRSGVQASTPAFDRFRDWRSRSRV